MGRRGCFGAELVPGQQIQAKKPKHNQNTISIETYLGLQTVQNYALSSQKLAKRHQSSVGNYWLILTIHGNQCAENIQSGLKVSRTGGWKNPTLTTLGRHYTWPTFFLTP